MTIPTTPSSVTVGGNGVQTVFSFPFVGDSASYIVVTYTNASGLPIVLNPSQYTVSLNAPVTGQIWGVGGSVTYPVSGTPIATGTSLTIQRILPLTQNTSISNQGNFYPQVVEVMGDTLEMQIQQVSARGGLFRGVWGTGISYGFGDIVQDGVNGNGTFNLYVCAIANTSGVWNTDLANGDWSLCFSAASLNPSTGYLPLTGGSISGNLTISGFIKGNVVSAANVIIEGATGNGTTNDTAAFQAAHDSLPASGGIIFAPAGTYLLSTVNITKPVLIMGAGGSYGATTIFKSASATGDVFYITSQGFKVIDCLFQNSVTRTAGAYIHGINVGSFTVRDVVMEGHYQGINVDGGTGILIDNCQFYKATPAATQAGSGSIFIGQNNYTGGVNVNNCLINSSPAGYASYGVWVGYVDVMSMSGNLIIESGDNLHISPGAGQFTALLSVVNCVFDTSTYGAVLLPLGGGNITRLTFSGCWFSVMSQNGILIDGQNGTVQGVTINKSYIMNNTLCGIDIDGVTGAAGNIRDISIDGNFIASNGAAGIQILDNPVNISITNNSIGAYAGGTGNGVGISMDSTPTGKITGNNFSGNTANIGGTPAGMVYSGNIGLPGIGTWTTYTPTVASTSGTLTTKSATGSYIQEGKTVTFEINATITTNGTGSGGINLSLPSGITAANASTFAGRGAAISSKILQGIVSANGSLITVLNYDGTYPASSGENLIISGTFQCN